MLDRTEQRPISNLSTPPRGGNPAGSACATRAELQRRFGLAASCSWSADAVKRVGSSIAAHQSHLANAPVRRVRGSGCALVAMCGWFGECGAIACFRRARVRHGAREVLEAVRHPLGYRAALARPGRWLSGGPHAFEPPGVSSLARSRRGVSSLAPTITPRPGRVRMALPGAGAHGRRSSARST